MLNRSSTVRIAALPALSLLRRTSRRALPAAFVGLGFMASAVPARAQLTGGAPAALPGGAFELRPIAGAYIPTGDQRDVLEDAVLAGVQGSWRIIPQLAITGTFAWSPSQDRLSVGEQTLDIFQYDIGAEARGAGWVQGDSWDFTPFVGLGVGGRTLSYRDLDVDGRTNVAGYGAVGGDLGFGRLGLRVEARDYVSRFEPLAGDGDAAARNDLALTAGLFVRF